MDAVYIETFIVNHATARPSADIQMTALQQQAREWWATHGPRFVLVTSQLVIDEASAGDPAVAEERLTLLRPLPIVAIDDAVPSLGREIVAASIMPNKAAADALHVAAAAVAGVQYLLTWNCSHIANARTLPAIRGVLDDLGVVMPFVCTPEEFVGNNAHF